MDGCKKVRQKLLPPDPIRLNVNAEVPTPFVLPFSWYIKQRLFWQLPKPLTVTVTADGKLDRKRYVALAHEDSQFGLLVSCCETSALSRYGGHHLVSVTKVNRAHLHYTLSRDACPCITTARAAAGGACQHAAGAAGRGRGEPRAAAGRTAAGAVRSASQRLGEQGPAAAAAALGQAVGPRAASHGSAGGRSSANAEGATAVPPKGQRKRAKVVDSRAADGSGDDSEEDGGSDSTDGGDSSDDSAVSLELIRNNPFRRNCCSCPCHVWGEHWPSPDEFADNLEGSDADTEPERTYVRKSGRGRGGGAGKGRKRCASAEPPPARRQRMPVDAEDGPPPAKRRRGAAAAAVRGGTRGRHGSSDGAAEEGPRSVPPSPQREQLQPPIRRDTAHAARLPADRPAAGRPKVPRVGTAKAAALDGAPAVGQRNAKLRKLPLPQQQDGRSPDPDVDLAVAGNGSNGAAQARARARQPSVLDSSALEQMLQKLGFARVHAMMPRGQPDGREGPLPVGPCLEVRASLLCRDGGRGIGSSITVKEVRDGEAQPEEYQCKLQQQEQQQQQGDIQLASVQLPPQFRGRACMGWAVAERATGRGAEKLLLLVTSSSAPLQRQRRRQGLPPLPPRATGRVAAVPGALSPSPMASPSGIMSPQRDMRGQSAAARITAAAAARARRSSAVAAADVASGGRDEGVARGRIPRTGAAPTGAVGAVAMQQQARAVAGQPPAGPPESSPPHSDLNLALPPQDEPPGPTLVAAASGAITLSDSGGLREGSHPPPPLADDAPAAVAATVPLAAAAPVALPAAEAAAPAQPVPHAAAPLAAPPPTAQAAATAVVEPAAAALPPPLRPPAPAPAEAANADAMAPPAAAHSALPPPPTPSPPQPSPQPRRPRRLPFILNSRDAEIESDVVREYFDACGRLPDRMFVELDNSLLGSKTYPIRLTDWDGAPISPSSLPPLPTDTDDPEVEIVTLLLHGVPDCVLGLELCGYGVYQGLLVLRVYTPSGDQPGGGMAAAAMQQRMYAAACQLRAPVAEAPPLLVAPAGKPLCRPAWDVVPIELDGLQPEHGTRIKGPLLLDARLHQEHLEGALGTQRLFVERNGYVDAFSAARCVKIVEEDSDVYVEKVPAHAKDCFFLGWGLMPGRSLVLRVASHPPRDARPPPASYAAAMAAAREAAALAAAVDALRRARMGWPSPALAVSTAGVQIHGSAAGGGLGKRPRRVRALTEVLKAAPGLPRSAVPTRKDGKEQGGSRVESEDQE